MILYDEANPAPNPRRVRIFIAEKGLDIPRENVPLRKRAHKSPEFRQKNSLGQVPVLALDDGGHISESVSICRYLDALNAGPSLFGDTPLARATIDMWIRRIENVLMTPVGMFWRHAHPLTAALLTQYKEFGESNREGYANACKWLDRELAGKSFIAGEAYSMADIVALTTIDFAQFAGLEMPPDVDNLRAWHKRVSERPSAQA